MKKRYIHVVIPATILATALTFAGCGAQNSSTTSTVATSVSSSSTQSAAPATSSSSGTTSVDDVEWYSNRDLEQSPDLSNAKTLTVTDGQTITITEEGTYVLTGTAANCTVLVNAPEAKVQLVLDGVSITNTSSPAIYVLDADKCFVTTAAGSSNSLSVTGTFALDTANNVNTDAVIFAKSDLTLNGTGSLTISSTKNAVTSKDDLTITGGTYNITATSGKGFESNDSIAINDGTFTINAKEGMESTYVRIDGGTISIKASDDGINATQNSTKYNVLVEINGGGITINMASGDTDDVDSNGDITINGGTINVTGTSTFDYDGTGTVNGGTVITNGTQVTTLPTQQMGGRGAMGGASGNNRANSGQTGGRMSVGRV